MFISKYEVASKVQKRAEMSKAYFEAVNYALTQSFKYYMLAATHSVGVHIVSQGWVFVANAHK